MRDHVGGGHEVDVVTAGALEKDHHSSQLLTAHRPPHASVADIGVLAEPAAQVAPGEEDRSAPMPARDRRLLAMMRVGGTHDRLLTDTTEGEMPMGSIHPACPGTAGTGIHHPLELGGPALQLAAAGQIHVGRIVRIHFGYSAAQLLSYSCTQRRRVIRCAIRAPVEEILPGNLESLSNLKSTAGDPSSRWLAIEL